MNPSLFKNVVPEEKLNPKYQHMQVHTVAEPARIIADIMFHNFPNPDLNFIEQFQTTGFDSRIFELYLFSYFYNGGYRVTRDHEQPDFIISNDRGLKVAIEATTVNPTSSIPPSLSGADYAKLSENESQKRLNDELPIRFGSPLFSKLNKRYWDLPQCKNIPIVFAIEAFFEEGSLYFSDSALGQYLYGLKHFPDWTEDGKLIVKTSEIKEHALGTKIIPSNFFKQPNAEHISAVIFSNSGTFAKFQRMGYIASYHRGNLVYIRKGVCYNFRPEATEPLEFSYNLDDPLIIENWGQGLMVFHNPKALYPIPRGYFKDAGESYLKDGQVKTDLPSFYPYMSMTLCTSFNLEDKPPIESITKYEYYSFKPARNPAVDLISLEKEWWADKERILLGSVLLDTIDNDWVYVILGRDEKGTFRWIDGQVSIEDREEARKGLIQKMKEIIATGQRIFKQ